jgi:indole-3-glycerol phosphate synthase
VILEKIVAYKKEELEHFKRRVRLEELKARARDARIPLSLASALQDTSQAFAVIAEIKKKSPSKGVLREDFDPLVVAKEYQDAGAAALSVLTDEHFFGGHLDHLRTVRQAVSIPLLRKDFLWDPYQVYAALDAGADAILLIAAMLEESQIVDLQGLAGELGLSVLLEVHDAAEAQTARRVGAALVGVNNRDLTTFRVDVAVTETLLPLLPRDALKVSESGLESVEVLAKLKASGVDAFLIGEALMKAESPGRALKSLLKV